MTLKRFVLTVIKYIPSSRMKVLSYRLFFKYKIGRNVQLGRVFINCKKVEIGDSVVISNRTVFSCNELYIGAQTKIHSSNNFIGVNNFSIGSNSRVINNHFFDLSNSIEIGDDTWIAGRNSEFWTHGSLYTRTGTKDLSIKIGSEVYIGSSCLIAPGTEIASYTLVAMGSVVNKKFEEENVLIAGNTASVVKKGINWRDHW
ncbi:acyltransferase [Winogradskyella aurantiaca]|uniref:acyltransferase n=1 Tax=Winogradskyella aurantiaca TaxID=2219558 RepID=UPI000E1DFA0F|nr:hypothetical protein [Winogradskyella aurantiaca]